ncbi:MAG: tetratricopeptide repeat protein [Candidatus Poribacteria bacterium]|nr:tetratricopeptide repeat protein [Candidatus Poribacteria bacterium]
MSTQKTELNRILEIIGKIVKISAEGDYIYRGEPECYEKVSSNLWRELEGAQALHLDIEDVQKAELEKAKRHIKKTAEFEILTEIQHFGGKTNLIDFTTDYYTAIFFACNGSPSKDGRIILQNKNGTIKNWIREPQKAYPENRVGTQKSIFVRPPDGFVEPDIIIVVPKDLKHPLLNYIEKEFGISTEKVYGDIHGFIGSQTSRLGTYKEVRKGIKAQTDGENANNAEGKNKRYQEAVKHFTNLIQQSPETAEVYSGRGLTYLSTGELDNALADFNKAIMLNQESAEAYNGRSAVYRGKGDFDNAFADSNKAIQLYPNDPQGYHGRGLAHLYKNDFDNAIADFSKAIALGPKVPELYNVLSSAYFSKGDFDNAIANLNEAIRLNPEFAEAYYTRGLTYDSKGELNKAIKDYTKAIALKPDHVSSYYNRGEAWLHLQEWKKAKEDLITAKELGMDIVAAFRNDYRNVAAFERTHKVKLPQDIVALVRQGFRHRYPMVEKALDSDGKPLESQEVLDLLKTFRNAGPPLGEYIKESSYFGIETVPTEVFVVDSGTRDELIASHPSSADVLKLFLQGPDIRRWHVEPQDQWLIFTYRGIEIKAYPAILKYLEKYKEFLSKRGNQQEWYELQASLEEVEHFAQPKLVCPNLYNTKTFAVETEGLYCGYTCYVIPTDETWLCGLLNTLPVEWFYSQVSKQLDGGKLEARGNYIKQIPVPNMNAAQKDLVRKLVDYLVCLQQQPTTNSKDLAHARDFMVLNYFEWMVKGLVYEFYMPDLLQDANKDIFKHLMAEELPEVGEIQGDKMSFFRSLYEQLHDRKHPVRVNLFFQDGLRPIRIIEDKW